MLNTATTIRCSPSSIPAIRGRKPRASTLALSVLFGLACAAPAQESAVAAKVWLKFNHTVAGAPLRFDDVSIRSAAGQTLSISRLDYLVTNVKLAAGDSVAMVTGAGRGVIIAKANRDSFEAISVPPGKYDSLEFDIGLAPTLNHSDPAGFGPTDPLNPQVNGLHWNWQGGYIFMAIEGRYVSGEHGAGNELGGYSFHVANDAHLMHVRLPVAADIQRDTLITLTLDAGRVFGVAADDSAGVIRIDHAAGTDSTHSAPGDELATALAANIAAAFAVDSARPFDALPSSSAAALSAPAGTTPLTLSIPAHFPQPLLPADNPLTVEGVALGRTLFFDDRLSRDESISCSSCHTSKHANSDPLRFSRGVDGTAGTRNSMPLFNLAWAHSMTWDGKRARIRDQALAPISDAREMKLPIAEAIDRLKASPKYPELFARAFGTPGVTPERLGLAIEQYLLTLVSADSKFDRVLAGREEFTPREARGLELFIKEYDPARNIRGADCFHCHGGNLFTDGQPKNNGLGVEADADNGRMLVTGNRADAGKFKTPSLRNVALTAPYMHDGRFATLEDVVRHYSTGVHRSESLDPNLAKHPESGIGLSDDDIKALVAFLESLTDQSFETKASKPQ
ncbi:MAG: cytochrome C peroxidase [Planctomycetes bacterium]|nr:cytochrome C peroxidase [Planctomycetota bacterium]